MIANSRGQLHATRRGRGRLLTATSKWLRLQGTTDEWARRAPAVTYHGGQACFAEKGHEYERVAKS